MIWIRGCVIRRYFLAGNLLIPVDHLHSWCALGRIEVQSVQQVVEELVGGFSLAPDIVDSFFEQGEAVVELRESFLCLVVEHGDQG